MTFFTPDFILFIPVGLTAHEFYFFMVHHCKNSLSSLHIFVHHCTLCASLHIKTSPVTIASFFSHKTLPDFHFVCFLVALPVLVVFGYFSPSGPP